MEVFNGSSVLKFIVPVEDLHEIERFVDEVVNVKLGDLTVTGILEKVQTKKKKNKETKDMEYFKELTITMAEIIHEQYTFEFPPKGDEFETVVDFDYVNIADVGDTLGDILADEDEPKDMYEFNEEIFD